jgi:hypothetical protein
LAKLLATRIGRILPIIVNDKQTGFVPKRQILDNISVAYLVREWAEESQTPILFIKLEFEKAFDRVDFDYLWQTLDKMGLGGKLLQLVKGLVIGARASQSNC